MAWNAQISIAFTITARNNGDQELFLPMKSKCKLQYIPGKSNLQPGKFLSDFYPSQTPTEATLFYKKIKIRDFHWTTPKLWINRSTSQIWKFLSRLDSIMASPSSYISTNKHSQWFYVCLFSKVISDSL